MSAVLRGHRWGLAVSAILAVVAGACSLAPYVAVYLVTVALFDPDGAGSGAIVWIALGTAVAIVVRAVASALSTHVGHLAAYRTLADLRLAIARQLGVLPLGRIQARSTGEMKKLLHDDVEQMEEALAHGVPDLAAAAAVPITTTILLFVVDWRLALVALGSLVLLVVVSGVGMALAQGNNKPFAEHITTLNQAVMGYLQGIKVIRGFLRPDSGYDQARSAIITGATLQHRVTSGPLSWLVSFMMVATGFAVALLLPVAGLQFADGSIDLATLALFLLIGLAYLGPLIGLVGVLATIMSRIQFAAAAIGEILAEPALPQSTSPQVPLRFDVAFDDVTFAYSTDTPNSVDARDLDEDADPAAHPRAVLDAVSLDIPAGARYALVGPTGAGKSTIARLVARFWDPTSGRVSIGGVDVRDIPSTDLARLVSFVQQDEYIFAATLRENVRIARPGASDAEVEAAGRAARLESIAGRLTNGWDSELSAGGGTLSGGERQRVSIARALLADAPIVVLDEATAALDAQTERDALAAIDEVTAGRTVIAIAHRLSTIRASERILYLDGGRITAAGSHEQLLAESPGYAALWNAYTRAAGWHMGATDSPRASELSSPPASTPTAGTANTTVRTTDYDAAALSIVQPGLGDMGFTRQWIALLGRGWPVLLRRGLPRLVIESLLRGIPLAAVFVILNAAVNSVTDGTSFDRSLVWWTTGVLTVGMVIRFLAIRWANGAVWTVAADSKADLQLSIVDRLRRVPLGFFSRVDNGRITTLVGNDTTMIDFQNIPQQIAAALIQPIYLSIVLLILDWRLGLAALIGFPIFVVITIWSDRIYHRVFADVHRARHETTMVLIEQAKGAAVLRGNPGSMLADRFAGAVERLRDTSIAMSVQAAPAVALGSIAVESGLVAVILVGSTLYSAGAVSATTLLLFLVITLTVYQPIQELNVLAGYRRNQQEIARKIGEVWDAPVLPEPEHPASAADATIEFRNVTFSYLPADEVEGHAADDTAEADRAAVLRNVSFTAPVGTITALVGPSGAGKSTIANLTARLWDVDSGAILIGGRDLRDLGSDAVMRLVTTVYQDVYLFNDTVRYNVSLGRPEATDEQIWAALEAAQCDDVVRALPDGLETVIDDAGTSLSGGQRQRLSIARALLKDSPILILDEAVASVDPDTEARIQDAIGRLAAGRTVLVIAHRLETVRDVDQILTVRDGTVTATSAAPAPA